MTLARCGDADLLDSQLRFHLAAGVELVLVADVEAGDEARAALEPFARAGSVRRAALAGSDEPAAALASLAANEHGAEWVIPAEPGEFWWPLGGSLAELLSEIPDRYGLVQGLGLPLVPVAGEGSFAHRMVYRLAMQAYSGDLGTRLRPYRTFARRVGVEPSGSDDGGERTSTRILRGWYPIDVLRFPQRSDPDAALGRPDVDRGVETGSLRIDTRVRDALTRLQSGDALTFPPPNAMESAARAVDAAVVGEAEVVGAQQRLDVLEGRLASLEANAAIRLEQRLRSLLRRDRSAS